ncbi:MAG: septum formation initiator family protein [Solirubrobacterales bacterium]
MRSGPTISPRPVARGAAFSQVRWDRVGRVAFLVALAVVASMYVRPLANFVEHWQGSKREAAELERVRGENLAVKRELKALETDAGLERVAREAGLVKEGERAYVIRRKAR